VAILKNGTLAPDNKKIFFTGKHLIQRKFKVRQVLLLEDETEYSALIFGNIETIIFSTLQGCLKFILRHSMVPFCLRTKFSFLPVSAELAMLEYTVICYVENLFVIKFILNKCLITMFSCCTVRSVRLHALVLLRPRMYRYLHQKIVGKLQNQP
jgi:hypothetical protein